MKTLLFGNPVFHPGINITVRKGIKWDLENGTEVGVASTEHPDKILFTTKIKTQVIIFNHISKDLLLQEHDPACCDYLGLLNEMIEIYPGFNVSEVVTVVEFKV